jgi:UrcA family protein
MTSLLSARALALSLVSALALASAATTQAAPVSNDPDIVTIAVPTADLNLASEAGAKTLVSRIHVAAETICGVEPATIQFDRHRIYEACVKATVDRTVATLDNPVVTAANTGNGPRMTVMAANRR